MLCDSSQAGKHQEYEQKLLQDLYKINPSFLQPPACGTEKSKGKSSSTQRLSFFLLSLRRPIARSVYVDICSELLFLLPPLLQN